MYNQIPNSPYHANHVGNNGNKLFFLLYFFLSHIELGKKEKRVLILPLLVLVE